MPRNEIIGIRVSKEEKERIKRRCSKEGFISISQCIRKKIVDLLSD